MGVIVVKYLSLQLADKYNSIDNLWEILSFGNSLVAGPLTCSLLEIIFCLPQIHIQLSK